MKNVFRREDGRFEAFDSGSGVSVWRQVSAENNSLMGCGKVVFEDCLLQTELPYDEYIYCTEGDIAVVCDDGEVVLHPGDAIWLSKGTKLTYNVFGRAAGVYAFAPISWKR